MDNRYHWEPRPDGDMLGEEQVNSQLTRQWAWLKTRLTERKTAITLIGAGLQILPRDKAMQERWSQASRVRLAELLRETGTAAVLLTGDVHVGQIFKTSCLGNGYPLYEVTSSGLTHAVDWAPEGWCCL